MKTYHKIQTVFKRDPANKHKTLLEGEFSLPAFEQLQYTEWRFTEKVDGMNIRVRMEGVVLCRGRTDQAMIPPPLQAVLSESFAGLSGDMDEFTFYGEGYGEKIQKGGGNYGPPRFVLFDILWDPGDGRAPHWMDYGEVLDIGSTLGLDAVPVIGYGDLDGMVEKARIGFISTWGDFQAEGIVARPMTELLTKHGERVITKIKCKDFR